MDKSPWEWDCGIEGVSIDVGNNCSQTNSKTQSPSNYRLSPVPAEKVVATPATLINRGHIIESIMRSHLPCWGQHQGAKCKCSVSKYNNISIKNYTPLRVNEEGEGEGEIKVVNNWKESEGAIGDEGGDGGVQQGVEKLRGDPTRVRLLIKGEGQ